jgi:hypothetical protein
MRADLRSASPIWESRVFVVNVQASINKDRYLLFGALAMQAGLISGEQFPEPCSFILWIAGMGGHAGAHWRQRRKRCSRGD